ncbi:hypothetical protein [Nonomuraea sp. NPDC049504]|uniref:hypothetical protein n=1 Tax=Nonomuraea sp. NPDC049504 TaxID=3154729 RepID=UPI0034491949
MDALVCGAGIAGPALAYWLRHHGFTPTVVERAPRRDVGGGRPLLRGERPGGDGPLVLGPGGAARGRRLLCAAASGRGASQALIGAYILAGELAAGGGHTHAFAAYEREMRGFVAEHQHLGREGADQFFLATPSRDGLGRTTAARPHLVRLKDCVPGFAAEWPSPGAAR